MSGRIEAGVRLMTVAEQSLASTRAELDGFISVLRTVTDPAQRSAQGRAHLTGSIEHTKHAVAAIAAARTSATGADGAAAALASLDDTRTAVDELHHSFDTLLNSNRGSNQAGVQLDPLGLQAQVEEARGRVAASRDALRALPGSDAVANESEFTRIAAETKRNKPATVTDAHVDEVAARAARLESTVGQMPTLEEIGVDMVSAARAGKYDNLVGREKEVDQLLTILARKRKANPVLLGDPGVGKTQLVEGLAVRIARGDVPESARDIQLWSLDAATIKAAAGPNQGDMEKLVKSIIDEVSTQRAKGNNVALFIDELHTLMGAGDTAQQLKPALARGDISVIGATTWEEFNRDIAKDGALVRRIAPITVEELSKPQVLDVLRSVQEGLSRHHDVIAYDSAVREVQTLSSRYAKDRKQPDPAIELLDHALSRVAKSWHGGAPAPYLELANEVGRLKGTIPALEKQVVMGDAGAAGQLVSAQKRLADIEPKVTSMTTQLEREREVLGTRHDLVKQYLAHVDAGETPPHDLQQRIADANDAVRVLRTEFPEPMLTDILDETAVREAASNLYGRTISAGGADDAKRLLALGDTLASKVIGQREATDMVAKAMKRAQSGMKRANAPAGAFLFNGPTGVGKTETVRVTADVMTGDPKNMIRIDMGEFSEPHSISKLFGSPPGYVGYEDSPALAALLKNPEAHVLFDEVEKAHPSIFQKLLPLFEEGRATLGDGTTIDASGATLYMTSNLPDDRIRSFFSPEFLNRLSGVIEFKHLQKPDVTRILDDLLLPKTLAQAAENGLDISVTDAAKARIVDYGFDSAMGARPLQRSIDNHLADPAGDTILELRAAGKALDPANPLKATLDVDPAGDGFLMRSPDLPEPIRVPARTAAEHAPGAAKQTHQSTSAANPARASDNDLLDWDRGGSAGGAARPPAPQPVPQGTGGN